jgi:hypothetical protein
MMSLGEDARTLAADKAAEYGRVLPLQTLTGRPHDLFRREFPEVWHQRQADPPGELFGFFHWGSNRDLGTSPATPRPDGDPITHEVDLAAAGLDPNAEWVGWELRTGEVVRPVDGRLTVTVPPHASRVVRLVRAGSEPGFLATDRHVLMGPGVVSDIAWDPAAMALTGTLRGVAGQPARVVVTVPDGFVPIGAPAPESGVSVVTVAVAAGGPQPFEARFTK